MVNNKQILIIVSIALVMYFLFQDSNGTKETLLCTSKEPTTFSESKITTILNSALNKSGFVNTDIIAVDSFFRNFTGIGYCDQLNNTGECENNKGIWLFSINDIPSDLKYPSNSQISRNYKGVTYHILGNSDSPNGIYFNEEKDIFIVFSGQDNDNIIEGYIDEYYNCTN
jgi:hypothetical protein